MIRHFLPLGAVTLIVAMGLSGCFEEDICLEGEAKFTIEGVIVTNELEIYNPDTGENETIICNDTKCVIISITIANKEEDRWLTVKTTGFTGLTDDLGNTYTTNDSFIEFNGSIYPVEQLVLIDENETLLEKIPPNSTDIRKTVFKIPIDREPKNLSISYGFSCNKLAAVDIWHHADIEIETTEN